MIGSKAARKGVGVLALALSATACGIFGGFHLSASNLQIGPNPAEPGDEVVATFNLNIAPVERHTVIFTINDSEYLRETSTGRPSEPYILILGDAADLIAQYGTGTHSARVEVRAEEKGRSVKTQTYSFELRTAAP